jgi:hypothetical protein
VRRRNEETERKREKERERERERERKRKRGIPFFDFLRCESPPSPIVSLIGSCRRKPLG